MKQQAGYFYCKRGSTSRAFEKKMGLDAASTRVHEMRVMTGLKSPKRAAAAVESDFWHSLRIETEKLREKKKKKNGGREEKHSCSVPNEPGIRWLVGSSAFFPPFTILSSFRSLHSQPGDDPFSPDFIKEADDIRALLLRGFDIIGAILVGNQNWEENALKAAEASYKMRKILYGAQGDGVMIGAAADLITGNIQFFIHEPGKSTKLEAIDSIIYEDNAEKFVWETGCLLRCQLSMRLPIYVPINRISEAGEIFSSAIDAAAAKFKDPNAVYIVEGSNRESEEVLQPVVLCRNELDFKTDQLEANIGVDAGKESDANPISYLHFFLKDCPYSAFSARKLDSKVWDSFCNTSSYRVCKDVLANNWVSDGKRDYVKLTLNGYDGSAKLGSKAQDNPIRVTVLFNQSRNAANSAAPIAEYFPVSEPSRLLVTSFKLDVLTYASKNCSVASAVSKLIVPGLVDQLTAMKKAIVPILCGEHPQLRPYHFFPPGFLHPITTIYDLSYGETEMKQVIMNYTEVSGGRVSLVQGSYEYYHYLQDGYDDNVKKRQRYTSMDVPSHREIQQALVEIGDKEPSFVESREWIGAIELSFVLDKLLGLKHDQREKKSALSLIALAIDKVSCKVINVRSGSELPEKCRELALHFETQGTPVMIGGGVLAYTLLGVDYNETSGDCAFLILDPHYSGTDELNKIVNGGWCGWKKAVDSKGRNFFLHDKFYNLLLPQRPNMV
ncbi:hypothetical protein ACLOJK_020739 [Asimina triloba]